MPPQHSRRWPSCKRSPTPPTRTLSVPSVVLRITHISPTKPSSNPSRVSPPRCTSLRVVMKVRTKTCTVLVMAPTCHTSHTRVRRRRVTTDTNTSTAKTMSTWLLSMITLWPSVLVMPKRGPTCAMTVQTCKTFAKCPPKRGHTSPTCPKTNSLPTWKKLRRNTRRRTRSRRSRPTRSRRRTRSSSSRIRTTLTLPTLTETEAVVCTSLSKLSVALVNPLVSMAKPRTSLKSTMRTWRSFSKKECVLRLVTTTLVTLVEVKGTPSNLPCSQMRNVCTWPASKMLTACTKEP
mmetsp:Transcript_22680/g.37368  ORF Transcript_22680/g.37368 Transcript_22680/m.37368 type:complete len:291 (-) Transcript_22680:698-1570(-)